MSNKNDADVPEKVTPQRTTSAIELFLGMATILTAGIGLLLWGQYSKTGQWPPTESLIMICVICWGAPGVMAFFLSGLFGGKIPIR